jgi:hypothetical protein
MATCAAFIEESRMKFADPTKLDRKSGAAEGSAVLRTFPGNVFRGSGLGFEARRADRQTSAQPGQGWGIDFPILSERRRRGTFTVPPE